MNWKELTVGFEALRSTSNQWSSSAAGVRAAFKTRALATAP